MGRISGRIFGFSGFFVFVCSDFGLLRSDIVLYTRAVFPTAGVGVQALHYGPIQFVLVEFVGRMFGRIFGFRDLSGFRPGFGLMRPVIVSSTRARFPNVGVFGACIMNRFLLFVVEFVGRDVGACDGLSCFYICCICLVWFGLLSVFMVARYLCFVQVGFIVCAAGLGPIVCRHGAVFVASLSHSCRCPFVQPTPQVSGRELWLASYRPHSGYGLVSPGIVLGTREVFPNARVGVPDLYHGQIFVNFGRICGREFWCICGFVNS